MALSDFLPMLHLYQIYIHSFTDNLTSYLWYPSRSAVSHGRVTNNNDANHHASDMMFPLAIRFQETVVVLHQLFCRL